MPKNIVKTNDVRERSNFNCEDVYRSRIKPMVEALVKECVIHDIPMIVAVCSSNTNTASTYHYDGISPEGLNLELANDFFGKMLCVTRGYDTVPPANGAPDDADAEEVSVRRISAESFEEDDD